MVDKQPLLEINTELIINNNYHAIHMARQLLQQCTQCKAWTFLRDCPHCDGTANAAAPGLLEPNVSSWRRNSVPRCDGRPNSSNRRKGSSAVGAARSRTDPSSLSGS